MSSLSSRVKLGLRKKAAQEEALLSTNNFATKLLQSESLPSENHVPRGSILENISNSPIDLLNKRKAITSSPSGLKRMETSQKDDL